MAVNDQRDRRLARIEDLRSAGSDPYPSSFEVDADVTTVRGRFRDLAPDTVTDERVRMVGRVMLVRHHGGIGFITLQQGGDRIQVVLERDRIGPERLDRLRLIDRGDVVGIEGVVGTSRSGELSVFLESAQLLAASLRPSPDKHRGPTSSEIRLREREVDLYANDESRRTFEVRSSATLALRDELHARDFIEVETPVFSIEAGGAAAKPFVTHHNALGIDLHLRVAPELYLKRLVVGGFDRVFEVARVFRNEGIDTRHNPEFTMLEVYQAPADYLVMMQLVQDLVVAAAKASIGSTTVGVGGLDVDLATPWRRATMSDLTEEVTGVRIDASMEIDAARAALDSIGVPWEPAWGAGKCLQAAFDARVEKTLIAPTIVMDHPVETSPLARRHRDDPTLTERFEVIVGGVELANAYSELNDPVEQRRRFEREQRRRERGDVEANVVDEDFLRALEAGMPPTGGLGIG
ncbi:MAG: lysine--tRNA ligase, partial [Acidimicrobiales bacterium]